MSIICRLPAVCPLLVVGVQPLTLERWGAGRISSPGRRTTARSGWKKQSLLSRSGWKNKQSLLRRSHTAAGAPSVDKHTAAISPTGYCRGSWLCRLWCAAASLNLFGRRRKGSCCTYTKQTPLVGRCSCRSRGTTDPSEGCTHRLRLAGRAACRTRPAPSGPKSRAGRRTPACCPASNGTAPVRPRGQQLMRAERPTQ